MLYLVVLFLSNFQGQSEWKEWFAVPFLSNPETNPTFMNYFSRHWQDTLMLSLHNFLAIIFASIPPPKILDFYSSSAKIKRLREENEVMRQTLLKQQQSKIQKLNQLDIPRPTDVMDDFYIIASHETAAAPQTENHAKGLKGNNDNRMFSRVNSFFHFSTFLQGKTSNAEI